jgi:hypothetical protein
VTGWNVIGWILIAALGTVIEGFALGFAILTVRAFNMPPERSGVQHIFRGSNES